MTQIEMPLMLLPLISVMTRIEPNLRDASAALGASRWRTLFTVIVPLSMPAWSRLPAGLRQFDHRLHLAEHHRRSAADLPAAADLAAVAGRLQLAFAAVASLALLVSVLSVISALSWFGRRASGAIHG